MGQPVHVIYGALSGLEGRVARVKTNINVGDSVTILPRFSHLYPNDSGIVVAIKPDPYRHALDEYTVKFPDDSTASLFEFQLVEVTSLD